MTDTPMNENRPKKPIRDTINASDRDLEREQARESYFASGGIESDLGSSAREAPWYWRRAALSWRERAESLGRKFTRLGDAWTVYTKYHREDTDKHSPSCPAARNVMAQARGECDCGLSAILKELSNGMGLAPEVRKVEASGPAMACWLEHRETCYDCRTARTIGDRCQTGRELANDVNREEADRKRGEDTGDASGPDAQDRPGGTRLRGLMRKGKLYLLPWNCGFDITAASDDDLFRSSEYTLDVLGMHAGSGWSVIKNRTGPTTAFKSGPQATPLTREQVECCRRIGRDEVARRTTIGLAELDALCDTAILGIGAVERLTALDAREPGPHIPSGDEKKCLRCGQDISLRAKSEICLATTTRLKPATHPSPPSVERGPHLCALTDYLSGRVIPGIGPELIDSVETLCKGALAALKHADVDLMRWIAEASMRREAFEGGWRAREKAAGLAPRGGFEGYYAKWLEKQSPAQRERPIDACDEPGCGSVACLKLDVPNPLGGTLPEGWTRIVVTESGKPRVALRCPEHPLPPGGIVTMGGKQVSPAAQVPAPVKSSWVEEAHKLATAGHTPTLETAATWVRWAKADEDRAVAEVEMAEEATRHADERLATARTAENEAKRATQTVRDILTRVALGGGK